MGADAFLTRAEVREGRGGEREGENCRPADEVTGTEEGADFLFRDDGKTDGRAEPCRHQTEGQSLCLFGWQSGLIYEAKWLQKCYTRDKSGIKRPSGGFARGRSAVLPRFRFLFLLFLLFHGQAPGAVDLLIIVILPGAEDHTGRGRRRRGRGNLWGRSHGSTDSLLPSSFFRLSRSFSLMGTNGGTYGASVPRRGMKAASRHTGTRKCRNAKA